MPTSTPYAATHLPKWLHRCADPKKCQFLGTFSRVLDYDAFVCQGQILVRWGNNPSDYALKPLSFAPNAYQNDLAVFTEAQKRYMALNGLAIAPLKTISFIPVTVTIPAPPVVLSVGDICPKCKAEFKKRELCSSYFIGCMC